MLDHGQRAARAEGTKEQHSRGGGIPVKELVSEMQEAALRTAPPSAGKRNPGAAVTPGTRFSDRVLIFD
jgi:hypothetical protein